MIDGDSGHLCMPACDRDKIDKAKKVVDGLPSFDVSKLVFDLDKKRFYTSSAVILTAFPPSMKNLKYHKEGGKLLY